MWHQPHPPGYVLYVLLLKFAGLFVNDANTSIILVNILISIVTLICFYLLSREFFEDEKLVFIATSFMSFSPIFWFYGSTATIYTVDALTASVLGYVFWHSIKSKDFKTLVLGSFLLGLLGGFRQTSIILFAPLWLLAVIRNRSGVKRSILCGAVFSAAVLLWLIPVLLNTGGLSNYLLASNGLTASGSEKVAIFFGGYGNYLRTNLLNFLVWITQGLTPLGLIVAIVSLISYLGKTPLRGMITNNKTIFLIVWVTPSVVMYLLYIEKAGYLLTLLPGLLIFITWSINRFAVHSTQRNIRKYLLPSFFMITMIAMIAWFVIPCSQSGIPQKINIPENLTQPPISDYNWDISARELRNKDYVQTELASILTNNPNINESNSVIFWSGGFPTWRHLMYYFPDFDNYWLVDSSVSGRTDFGSEYYYSKNDKTLSYSGSPFWMGHSRFERIKISLGEEMTSIIWIGDQKTAINNHFLSCVNPDKVYRLSNGQEIYFIKMVKEPIDLGTFLIVP